jgi:hypothetical protein
MDLQMVINFILSNIQGMAVGAIGTVLFWQVFDWMYDKVRPFKEVTNFMVGKVNQVGLNTKRFWDTRKVPQKEQDKFIADIKTSSDQIEDAFIKGLKGIAI